MSTDHPNRPNPHAPDAHLRCPRCWGFLPPVGEGGVTLGRALSRATRDEGAEVDVCSPCGEREALRQERGQVIPLTDWPLSLEALAEEDAMCRKMIRSSTLSFMTITPDDARDMLGDDETQP